MNQTALRLIMESLRLAGSIYVAYISSRNIVNLMDSLHNPSMGPSPNIISVPRAIDQAIDIAPGGRFDPEAFLRKYGDI